MKERGKNDKGCREEGNIDNVDSRNPGLPTFLCSRWTFTHVSYDFNSSRMMQQLCFRLKGFYMTILLFYFYRKL